LAVLREGDKKLGGYKKAPERELRGEGFGLNLPICGKRRGLLSKVGIYHPESFEQNVAY